MLEFFPTFVSFLTVGAGCGFLLINALFNAMANEELLQKDGRTFGQFSIIQGSVGMSTGLLYAIWNIRCPHLLTMRQEQIGVTILIAMNVVAFLVLSSSWSIGAPDYPVFVGAAVVAQFIGNFTIYLLFPMVATYYAGWLVAPVRAGTDVSSLVTSLIGQAENPHPGSGELTFSISTLFFIYAVFSLCGLLAWSSIMYFGTGLRYEVDKEEGTVTLSESEDESDDSQTLVSDSDVSQREAMVKRKRDYLLEGFACPRKLVLPVILATLSQVAQWGIAASLGQIGAAMTDPESCHGSQGKRIYRLSLTSSMIAVPVGSILSTTVTCPRLLFNILSAIQITSAVLIADCALGLFSVCGAQKLNCHESKTGCFFFF